MENKQVFALDIGTRKVTGLIMEKNESGYEVLASETIQHNTRAMMDGQIHDVEAVAAIIIEIKNRLEKQTGKILESAAVAAAGRALKTAQTRIEKQRSGLSEITTEEVRALEIEAIQKAQYRLAQEEGDNQNGRYFCVGYSVVNYQLEEQSIVNLVGQVASQIAVEVIATFLPRVVVDSLFSALKRADLEVLSMTLEPIAALSVAIPPNMRLLNLALVDIGAGTSDIAIVKNNHIFAYAMVPFGGDELTEHLASTYLLDFNSAEGLKCRLSAEDEVNFVDILGNVMGFSSGEIVASLEPVIQDLSSQIAKNILELNQKAPDAVVCVGGGSLTPGLSNHIAREIEIPSNRVGIRTRDSFSDFSGDFSNLEGPQGVTPLGIAYQCLDTPPVPFIKVKVNEREVPLWNLGEIDVAAAILSSGINLSNVYGKPGMGKTLEVNGKVVVFKGNLGTGPVIKVNGQDTGLDEHIHDGDNITFAKGVDGQDAIVTLSQILTGLEGKACVNGEEIILEPQVSMNGEVWKDKQKQIPDRGRVQIEQRLELGEVLRKAGVKESLLKPSRYQYWLNEKELFLDWMPLKILIDGLPADLRRPITPGANIAYWITQEKPCIKNIVNMEEKGKNVCQVLVNGETIELGSMANVIVQDGQPLSLEDELVSGMRLSFQASKSSYILSDIFQVINIKPPVGGRLIIKVDGQEAGFTTPVINGSNIELRWD
ncbi:MAG: cell division FtsA domain-containing protein [Bacillota bacterium]|nr:cell division FtsA domain-containing protein [Bacillota bacterium]